MATVDVKEEEGEADLARPAPAPLVDDEDLAVLLLASPAWRSPWRLLGGDLLRLIGVVALRNKR